MRADGEDKIVLARPEDLVKRPSVGLHLLVKNGASVVGRLLDQVGPYLEEVVVVLNDCSDETESVVVDKAREHGVRRVVALAVTSQTHPRLYIADTRETYEVGRPLCGETMPGPFLGAPLLADWAAARNIGWERHAADFKLFLDADDVVLDPSSLFGLCFLMDERGLDCLSTKYVDGLTGASGTRERLCRNLPDVRWVGAVHEVLAGYDPSRVAHVDGSFVVVDRRDSSGVGTRAPGRNLKVLYHLARLWNWALPVREMVYLAVEARHVMPELAKEVAKSYVRYCTENWQKMRPVWGDELAWMDEVVAEVSEREQDLCEASAWYDLSVQVSPRATAFAGLVRTLVLQSRWADVVAADEGLSRRGFGRSQLGGGDVCDPVTKVLVARSLQKLGRQREASETCLEALSSYPRSPALSSVFEDLGAS